MIVSDQEGGFGSHYVLRGNVLDFYETLLILKLKTVLLKLYLRKTTGEGDKGGSVNVQVG